VLAGSQNSRREESGGEMAATMGEACTVKTRQPPLKLDKWAEKFTYSGHKFTFDE
jgi:hypothetical protein